MKHIFLLLLQVVNRRGHTQAADWWSYGVLMVSKFSYRLWILNYPARPVTHTQITLMLLNLVVIFFISVWDADRVPAISRQRQKRYNDYDFKVSTMPAIFFH